jgi:hypothetical protein
MKKIVSFSAIVLLLVACDKGKFETKPQLTLKSINNTEIRFGAPLQIVLEFTDKEGDVSDTLAFIRQRLNASDPFTAPPSYYSVPDSRNATKGEIEMKLEYQTDVIFNIFPIRIPGSNPEKNEKDTMRYKIVVHDKGGNTSDTVTIDNIIVDRDQ